jgi:tetratricopeptide (TPR) repeat protein
MELSIKPQAKNAFPLAAVLVRGASLASCLKEIQSCNWSLNQVEIFPVPGCTANSTWGYLIIPDTQPVPSQSGKHELIQMVTKNLFIADRSALQPPITNQEINLLFSPSVHLFHPETGLSELKEKLDLSLLIQKPSVANYRITRPEASVFIPDEIISFQIRATSPETALENLEKNSFPDKEEIEKKPLTLFEKAKLFLYKLAFTSKKTDAENTTHKKNLWNRLESIIQSWFKKDPEWSKKLMRDYEDLEYRNQKELDKLIDLFKKDPAEALKYAIPLDESGTSRGEETSALNLFKRWTDFSSPGSSKAEGSGTVSIGSHYFQLQKQYLETAKLLIAKKEFQKAAFVYMKLLKDYHAAGQTLEVGGHFQEAASIYLKYLDNKPMAASCYEKGNMINDAIEIYKVLHNDEKVGDLYLSISKKAEAEIYFEKVITQYTATDQYVKAALVYKNKMNDKERGQNILLTGWHNHKDAYNCLNNYFNNIEDPKKLKTAIDTIYRNDLDQKNEELFLKAIGHEYKKHQEPSNHIKDIAYEIIARLIPDKPGIVTELKYFNEGDKQLVKDTIRFQLGKS